MADNDFRNTVETLFRGMDNFITSKTVVGDAVNVGNDTVIVPLVDVSFGVGAGAFAGDKRDNGGGGMGGKMTPSAVLVISKGSTKLIDVKSNDGLGKILDMVPDVINKLTNRDGEGSSVSDFMQDLQGKVSGVREKAGEMKEKAAKAAEENDPYDSEANAEENIIG